MHALLLRTLGGVCLAFANIFGASAASFDCTKATTTIEKMICQNDELGKLDEDLAQHYRQAISEAPDAQAVRQSQVIWLRDRRNKCADETCLLAVYRDRISNLVRTGGSTTPAISPVPQTPANQSWYYCDNPAGYYPYVQTCNGPWRPVDSTAEIERHRQEEAEKADTAELQAAKAAGYKNVNDYHAALAAQYQEKIEREHQAAAAKADLERQAIRQKGVEFAKASDTDWEISRTNNEMTDQVDTTVVSFQKNATGGVAQVTGSCETKGIISFVALLVDAEGKPTLNFPDRDFQSGAVPALIRVNNDEAENGILGKLKFANQFVVARLMSGDKGQTIADQKIAYAKRLAVDPSMALPLIQQLAVLQGNIGILPTNNRLESTWRLMAQIDTSKGPLLIKIPIYDDSVQILIKSCLQ